MRRLMALEMDGRNSQSRGELVIGESGFDPELNAGSPAEEKRVGGFNSGAADGKHYWLTPPALMEKLNAEFSFNHDACPWPKPDCYDGLRDPWGTSTYCNPPFGSIVVDGRKMGPTAWARKALSEHAKGNGSVLVYPIDKWIHYLINAGAELRSLGDVRWYSTEDYKPGKGMGRYTMAFILKPKPPTCGEHE